MEFLHTTENIHEFVRKLSFLFKTMNFSLTNGLLPATHLSAEPVHTISLSVHCTNLRYAGMCNVHTQSTVLILSSVE